VFQPFKNIFDFFYLTRRQRKGMSFLFIILVLLASMYIAIPLFIDNTVERDLSFAEEVQNYLAAKPKQETPIKIAPFYFDPNTISSEQLLQLGLSEYQASMIEKYRNAGGKFTKKEDFKKIYSITDEEYSLLEAHIIITPTHVVAPSKEKPTSAKYFPAPFDPNSVDSLELAAMGFGSAQIANIINYRNAGGKFRIKQDFKKLYSINDDLYAIFEKNILLPSADSTIIAIAEPPAATLALVEINSADTSQLQLLKGIGPTLAKRIVDYRQRLGGFYDKSQLLEVFGIDTARYHRFSEQVVVDRSKIVRKDLNAVQFSELLKNPYIEYYIVQSIFSYRDAIGRFDSVGQLKKIDLIYSQLYQKLEPYLLVQNTED